MYPVGGLVYYISPPTSLTEVCCALNPLALAVTEPPQFWCRLVWSASEPHARFQLEHDKLTSNVCRR